MILRTKNGKEYQFVYEFPCGDDAFVTSKWFTLPTGSIYYDHDHPWVVIMREVQRVITDNWSDLNEVLQYLIDEWEQYRVLCPDRDDLLDFITEHVIDENDPGWPYRNWLTYPSAMMRPDFMWVQMVTISNTGQGLTLAGEEGNKTSEDGYREAVSLLGEPARTERYRLYGGGPRSAYIHLWKVEFNEDKVAAVAGIVRPVQPIWGLRPDDCPSVYYNMKEKLGTNDKQLIRYELAKLWIEGYPTYGGRKGWFNKDKP